MTDPHVAVRELLTDDPDAEMGHPPMHHAVPRLDRTPGAIRLAAPSLGQHNHELLEEIGMSPGAYQELQRAGVTCGGGGGVAAVA